MSSPLPGHAAPLGATPMRGGVNFSLFSRNATGVELLLFANPEDPQPQRILRLDPQINRTFYYWHIFVPGIGAGQLYAYRVYGPYVPERGLRFDPTKVLLDPYARAVTTHTYRRKAASQPGDNCAEAARCVVVDLRGYDWEGDEPLQHPFASSVLYELHVGAFTRDESSGLPAKLRGSYAGLIEKIPYLKQLGITAVELLPVQQFDAQEAPFGLSNDWGYAPMAFFAPHNGYSSQRTPLGPVMEFRQMVKAFHRAGIEVILDVVFNHTAENGPEGPTLSLRGIENRAYYLIDPQHPERYQDYSGCGNSLDASHSIVRRMIMDCLHYWVQGMHVDGFRFDLASVLARDKHGQPLNDPPILWEIESDPILAGTKIIAEAWDAGGLYQVGSFIGHRWAEWNGQFRDDVRRFLKGDTNSVRHFAARLSGSRDLYPQTDRIPARSINFVTCHDGFTLNDLVSYNQKHNERNLQGNRDGLDANFSWNCGVEGPTDDPQIEALRARQIKNFFISLLCAQGTPMLLMGDEVRRTQQGNNNAYCQRVAFDWNSLSQQANLLNFVKQFIAWRSSLNLFKQPYFWSDPGGPQLIWHGVHLNAPDWGVYSHSLACELGEPDSCERIYLAFNAYWEALNFELPLLPTGWQWALVSDSARPGGQDFCNPPQPLRHASHYLLVPRSAIVLQAVCDD